MSHLPEHLPFKPSNTGAEPNNAFPAPMIPRLTVVGAGPGDPELITLKAVKALQSADVVLYDALANEALLQHTRPTTSLVYVGKRKGAKAYTQEEINERIVAYAHCCGHVVRLKGGDPFFSGRGSKKCSLHRNTGFKRTLCQGFPARCCCHRHPCDPAWRQPQVLGIGFRAPEDARPDRVNAVLPLLR
jgi:Tetrapyrrole (Corrin/Porphyrin) Methylases